MTLDLAIVTSCYNYGRYLLDWAHSILALSTPPAMVVIVDNGSSDDTPAHVEAAATLLRERGLSVVTERIPTNVDFGTARNRAVALADAEWVMHLDADDTVMPHCLDDVAALAPDADVVALGYERTGDLKAGPPNRTKVYRNSQGPTTLASSAPASGVSPFRRALWERSPYRTDMRGGWDTALWLGFAHLGARFRATRRPCFWYRQHADSVFNTRRVDALRTALTGTKLERIRQGCRGVSVIIPWEDDEGPRARALEWVERRYRALFPDWQLVRGHCRGEVWRKGVAIADALERATGLVLVIADADCVVAPDALAQAVHLVSSGRAPWVVPHSLVHRLDEASTETVLAQDPAAATFAGELIRAPYQGFAGGGLVVVGRAEYEATGGIPRRFAGWGAEDVALGIILDTILGSHTRLPADLWHLWHPTGARWSDPNFRENLALLRHTRSRARRGPAPLYEFLMTRRLPRPPRPQPTVRPTTTTYGSRKL